MTQTTGKLVANRSDLPPIVAIPIPADAHFSENLSAYSGQLETHSLSSPDRHRRALVLEMP